MIIAEPLLQRGGTYLNFNFNDDYDQFGGRGKAKRQEKKQVRQEKRSGKKLNRLSGKMTRTVGKQQLRANNFGLTRRPARMPLPAAPAEPAELMQEAQPIPESPAEQAPEMAPPPQSEPGPEAQESSGEEGTDSYSFYVGAPKSGEDKPDSKESSYGPLIGIICVSAILILAGYALHKSMQSDLPKPVIRSRPINQYGYTRRTH